MVDGACGVEGGQRGSAVIAQRYILIYRYNQHMKLLGTITAKKSLGQNFLNNPNVPIRMADAATLQEGERVLEIGPGTGMLTREFLSRGALVTAVEADERAIESLQETFAAEIASGALTLLHDDIRTFDPKSAGCTCGRYKLIANIPYYLSGFLFRQFLESSCQPQTLVFLTQKEVAERIARDPKESLLSLGVKAYGTPRYIQTVKRGNFTPSPKVDSAIICVDNISKERFTTVTEREFFELLHLGFASKRKQLLGSLAKKWPRETILQAFSTTGLPEKVRGEDVPLTTWLQLAKFLYTQA